MNKGIVSLNTLEKRMKVPLSAKGYEKYLAEDARFVGAKLVLAKKKAYLYVSISLDAPDCRSDGGKVAGIDRGIVNHAVTYDGKKTRFHSGRKLKEKRAKFKDLRQSLQKRGTPSSRRRLRAVGKRKSRYVNNMNHVLAKTLVSDAEPGITFVLEDLSGVKGATARVRYICVSWPYHGLEEKLEYKARLSGCAVIYIEETGAGGCIPVRFAAIKATTAGQPQ